MGSSRAYGKSIRSSSLRAAASALQEPGAIGVALNSDAPEGVSLLE